MTHWLHLDWVLVVVAAWLLVGLAGVFALRRFRFISRILFPAGGAVDIDALVGAGAVRKNQLVKVLGDGDLDGVVLQVSANAFSGSAKEKLAAAGGSATTV